MDPEPSVQRNIEIMVSAVTTTENKEIVRQFAEQFINDGNHDAATEFLAEDIHDHTPMSETIGRDAVIGTAKQIETAFPDFTITIESIIADGDTVAVRMTQRGTHEGVFLGIEPTGKAFEISAMAFLRVEDGKIVERRGSPDILGMFRQLGITELPAA